MQRLNVHLDILQRNLGGKSFTLCYWCLSYSDSKISSNLYTYIYIYINIWADFRYICMYMYPNWIRTTKLVLRCRSKEMDDGCLKENVMVLWTALIKTCDEQMLESLLTNLIEWLPSGGHRHTLLHWNNLVSLHHSLCLVFILTALSGPLLSFPSTSLHPNWFCIRFLLSVSLDLQEIYFC